MRDMFKIQKLCSARQSCLTQIRHEETSLLVNKRKVKYLKRELDKIEDNLKRELDESN